MKMRTWYPEKRPDFYRTDASEIDIDAIIDGNDFERFVSITRHGVWTPASSDDRYQTRRNAELTARVLERLRERLAIAEGTT